MIEMIECFNFSEKDLVMFLFFGSLFLIMLIMWAIEDSVKWYKENREAVVINAEFMAKIMLLPILSLRLRIAGVSDTARKRKINIFLYA